MKKRMLRWYGALLATVLAWLGFSSCRHTRDVVDEIEESQLQRDSTEIRLMYGVYPTYRSERHE